MSVLKKALLRLCGGGRSERAGFEIDAELRFHLEMRAHDSVEAGMTPEEARNDAFKRFGNVEQVRERCISIREAGGMSFWKSCLWMSAGCWLAFWAMTPRNVGLRAAILEACAVLILFFLLANLRAIQRDRLDARAIEGGGAKLLGLVEREEAYADIFAQDERTPVERLLRDE